MKDIAILYDQELTKDGIYLVDIKVCNKRGDTIGHSPEQVFTMRQIRIKKILRATGCWNKSKEIPKVAVHTIHISKIKLVGKSLIR